MPIKAILTDIEGTTSSISFVKETLFPYAKEYIPSYARTNKHSSAIQKIIQDTSTEIGCTSLNLDEAISQWITWIDEDVKSTALKELQGHVWKAGYENGDYQAHTYNDATKTLQAWSKLMPLYIYSSGSIAAQKLFFGYSDAGNINNLFKGYFDTTSGPKREQQSYLNIIKTINLPATNILFLSDIIEELDAAKAAGMQCCLLVRENDTTYNKQQLDKQTHRYVSSFEQINLDEYK